MSLPCQGWTQGCAGGSSGSSSWIPGTNSSLCSPKMLHPSMDSPGSGTQAVAVPWQGPVRSPAHVLALHALVAPPSPCARQSIIPPAWLPSGPGALPALCPAGRARCPQCRAGAAVPAQPEPGHSLHLNAWLAP